ncbi:hypothetical protein BH11PSE9_BH11PSE9_28870 [soil metagenome]
MSTRTLLALLAAFLILPLAARAAQVDDAVAEVEHDWEVIEYQTPTREREARFEALWARAHRYSEANPDRSEPLVWEGIVATSVAGEKNLFVAPVWLKRARAVLEQALKIDPDALDGLAFEQLGVLYYKAWRWPVGFWDEAKAGELLQRGLAINPKGLDANFFYGEFMLEQQRPAEALGYLERAVAAPPRPGRQISDSGRREEARQLLARARGLASR